MKSAPCHQPKPPGQGRAVSISHALRERLLGDAVLTILGAFAVSLIAGGLIIASIGVDPARAIEVGVRGALGTTLGLSNSLVFAAPRLLVALGAAVAIRSGVFNLGVEGQLQMGAVGAAAVGVVVGPLVSPAHLALAILAAGVAGGVWAAIAGFLKIWRGADELIVTLMMSFIAIYFVQYLVQGPFQAPKSSFAQSPRIAASAELPRLIPDTRLHLGFVIALLLYRTTVGAQFRAVGFNARAACLAGLPVGRLVMLSMFCSGFVAGLAGAGEILGVQFRLIQGFSPGFGFEGLAIAITIFGRWHPAKIAAAALLFGGAEALQFRGQAIVGRDVPPALLLMFPFVLALLAWVALGRGQSGPADLGRPFLRSEA